MAAPEYPAIPIIAGPTGSGKTAVALALAQTFPIAILAADSRQVVRGCTIGTGKPTAQELAIAPVYGIDLIDPGERYSAARYQADATLALREMIANRRIPLVVGGTGLYLRVLTDGLVELDDANLELREQLETAYDEQGGEHLWDQLNEFDPLEATKVHPNNRTRLIRALEIYHRTGRPKSEVVAQGAHRRPDYRFERICLWPPRDDLYRAINSRVEAMVMAGWLDEVAGLLATIGDERLRRSAIIGYTELIDVCAGVRPLDEATSQIKQETRRLAKRQYTWFRQWPEKTRVASVQEAIDRVKPLLDNWMDVVNA